jgi:hypothetical protein
MSSSIDSTTGTALRHLIAAAAGAPVAAALAAAAARKPAVYVRDFAVFKPDPRWVGCCGGQNVVHMMCGLP